VSVNRRFDPTVNYYAVLGVSVDASRDEINRSYRQLMRRIHPDRFPDPAERQRAEEHAKEVNAAYAILSRPDIRREYDSAARRTVMAQAVSQRYQRYSTPTAPPRPRTRPRPTYTQRPRRPYPTEQAASAQRSAYKGAVWRLALTFGGITIILILIILLGNAAVEGVKLLFS
jgi:curved DNA-binding protein CbpA